MLTVIPARAAAGPEAIEFLYIDANTSGSSGGHVAIKLGDTVYHFQNDDGYSRLTRESWLRFRFLYNDVDNRNIHVARVPVRASVAERVRDRLGLLFMVQNRHVDFLHALQQDEYLLEALQAGMPVSLSGIGFFERRPHESAALSDIRERLAQRLGPVFIASERQRLSRQLAELRYAQVTAETAGLSPDRYPAYPPTFAERAQDDYARWLGLTAIEQGWPLRDDALTDAGRLDAGDGPPASGVEGPGLGGAEGDWLSRYRTSLQAAIEQVLVAPYPGSGTALLLSLARYQAVSLSLASGRLRLLDVLPADRRRRPPLTADDREPLQRLIAQLQTLIPPLRKAVFALPDADEAAYYRLEVAAAEWREAERGLRYGHVLHLSQGDAPPEGRGYALLPIPPGTPAQLADAHRRAAAFLEHIKAAYGYQLITRNCVTELARAVNSSFAGQDETAALGGHLAPGAAQGFVPFRFFELVRQHYRVDRVEELPSYRNRQLQRLSRDGADWSVFLREGNTLTATLYHHQEGDSAFLLFTEHGFLTRPLFGALNFAYATGAATAGLFSAPADQGALLGDGLHGMLFSLPELAFWTIRKGRFNEMSPRQGGDE